MSRIYPKLSHIAWREVAIIGLPALALLLAVFWGAFYFVKPAPPHQLRLTTGGAASPYGRLGLEYQAIMQRSGITVELKNSTGALDNLARLRNPAVQVDAGFVQGGLTGGMKGSPSQAAVGALDASAASAPAGTGAAPKLVSLGSLMVEPLWLFYRQEKTITRLSELAGLRIGIGSPGSGTHKLAVDLLQGSGIGPAQAKFSDMSPDFAAKALLAGELDAVFVSSAVDSAGVQPLRNAPGVRLMHWEQAAAYARTFPYMAKVTLPQGALDFAKNLPDRDTDMIATTVNLIVRDDLHPALMYLLLDTAQQLHGQHGLFQVAHEYPSTKGQDMELADEAKRFYKSGKPFLQRYLPFWLANLADRLMVLLIPLLAVLIPAVSYLPDLYNYRMRKRFAHWYKILRLLEQDLGTAHGAAQRLALTERLDQIEMEIGIDPIPAMNSDAYYQLRSAIDLIRDRLGRPEAKTLSVLRTPAT